MRATLTETTAPWLTQRNPDDDLVFATQCRLVRNLADFPFPGQCSPTESRSVKTRILEALDGLNLTADGEIVELDKLEELEKRVLLERGLIRPELLKANGSRAVYISQDEALSISINEEEHLVIAVRSTGLRPQESFNRASRIDDLLSGVLDFAYDERRGYLTAALDELGTGMKLSVWLHLTALHEAGLLAETRTRVEQKRHVMDDAFDPVAGNASDLYVISNAGALGRSEEEFIFHVKHLVGDIVEQERHQRTLLQKEMPLRVEDRVFRALGLARSARLLALNEGLQVLSSLRLGHAQGLLQQCSLQLLNEVYVASQSAHLETRHGRECDELTINADRAELFRARFA
jgi:protein arginine kinase